MTEKSITRKFILTDSNDFTADFTEERFWPRFNSVGAIWIVESYDSTIRICLKTLVTFCNSDYEHLWTLWTVNY